jgi:hypothetical protein
MQRARPALACLAVSLFFAVGASIGDGQSLSGVPTKIEVTGASYSGSQQQGVEARVQLLDPSNRPAVAKKDFEVELASRAENGTIEKSKIVIKQGATSATARLPIKSSGLVEVTASNPHLAEGGTIVDVGAIPIKEPTGNASPTPEPSATLAPSPSPPGPSVTSGTVPAPSEHRAFTLREHALSTGAASATGGSELEWRRGTGERRRLTSALRASPSPDSLARSLPATPTISEPISRSSPSAESDLANWNPVLKLRYSPNRPLRADEKDPATIWASLPGDPARVDMSIYIMSDLGPLTPDPIKIPKGERLGQGQLIANHPGAVQVWYEYSSPTATMRDPPLTINFSHPVWAPKLVPIAPRVGLFEPIEVAVELTSYRDISVPSDTERQVNLSIGSGNGELSPTQVIFKPNESRVITKFIPTWPGAVRLIATSPYLPQVSGDLTVTMPYVLLMLCAAGSLTGALLAFWTEKPAASWQRIPIGLITGFILYWAFLFGVVHVPNFPHAYVVNPFSAFILAVFGGWGGTKVIALVLKQLGLQW